MSNRDSSDNTVNPQRREFLTRSGALLGVAGLANLIASSEAHALRQASTPEKSRLRLGFMPLTDCAPLVVALEQGFFASYGLDVELHRETSWANIRDKVAVGEFDAAHMLAGTPLAIELGVSPVKERMQTSFSLDLNGNAITVSDTLFQHLLAIDPDLLRTRPVTAAALKQLIDTRRNERKVRVRLGMVSRFSRHNYELRYWLAAAGIDPDRDVELLVIPPQHMPEHLQAGLIDGFCVGEPWNTIAVHAGAGRTLISSYEIWNNGPEKIFGVTRAWAAQYPRTHRLLLRALLDAARWLDAPANRVAAAQLLAHPRYLNVSPALSQLPLGGHYLSAGNGRSVAVPDFNVFYRYAANFPWRSHAMWLISQMYRWGQVEESVDIRAVAEAVYRPRPFREAAALAGVPYPLVDYKSEGTHAEPWTLAHASAPITLGADRFFDGNRFDPGDITAYLQAFDVHGLKVSVAELGAQNA